MLSGEALIGSHQSGFAVRSILKLSPEELLIRYLQEESGEVIDEATPSEM